LSADKIRKVIKLAKSMLKKWSHICTCRGYPVKQMFTFMDGMCNDA